MSRLIETESQGIPDAFGVPSYFATIFFAEPAGDGCIRLFACARINGVIVPQYVSVMPARSVIEGSGMVREMALAVMTGKGDDAVH